MKRISNFTADRMDMQEMAAINGGVGTTGSTTTPTQHPCGVDSMRTSWRDIHFTNIDGRRVEHKYGFEFYRLEPVCRVAINPGLDPGVSVIGDGPIRFQP